MFPLTFKWEKRSDLPSGANCETSCIANNKVYTNPGVSIYEYTPDTDTWVKPTPTKDHGMLSLNGKLTLVGGVMKDSKKYSRVI